MLRRESGLIMADEIRRAGTGFGCADTGAGNEMRRVRGRDRAGALADSFASSALDGSLVVTIDGLPPDMQPQRARDRRRRR